MSRLKLFFDLLILLLFVGLLFFLYRSETPKPGKQNFHPSDFNYHGLKRLVFNDPDFIIEVPDLKAPQLVYQERRVPAAAEWLHRYINNLFTLPDMVEFPVSDTKEAYGFKLKPDVLVEGNQDSFAMFLGGSVPGNGDFFYFSFRENYVTQLAEVYRSNIKWTKELFLPRSPLVKDWEVLRFDHPGFPVLEGAVFRRQEGRLLIEGKSESFDPLAFSMEGQGLFLKVEFDNPVFTGCHYFFTVDDEEIHSCAEGLLNATHGYGWRHNEVSEKWVQKFPLNLFSRKFRDYVPDWLFSTRRVSLSDGRQLDGSLHSFLSRLQRLQRTEGVVAASPFVGKSFALHFENDENSFSLPGNLSADGLFSFLIIDNYYFQMDLSWFMN
jgi:hypothetical protein